jgi:hypothetical protein
MQLFENEETVEVADYARLGDVDLDAFPVVRDFRVGLEHGGGLGWHVRLVSSSRGLLAGFPWWDHADRTLKGWSEDDVFTGTTDAPLDRSQEGWQILIFERDEHVYVLEADQPRAKRFRRYFSVPRDKWLSGWMRAVEACKAGKPKDVAVS